MERRDFIKRLALLAACPLCAETAYAAEAEHWSYEGEAGPEHWGSLSNENSACSAGSQQSPLDIRGAIKADIPGLALNWKSGGAILNNGHTIQVKAAPGGTLRRGDKPYELVQYHFHAPSEHLVEGHRFPMEVHFVHKHAETGALGVLGVFFVPGAANTTFASLAATFPQKTGEQTALPNVDPSGLLPTSLRYWAYEGSLTTPPCSEIVDWMIAQDPIEVDAADIDRFTALYSMNARPALVANRRYILAS
ncbi:carbonate dehydratase [Sinorhizobium medicae]|uniref:Carbonic anhydrase n=3 Tax=Sinorhizobium medicae TaxID=110321 RepID=A0A6G1WU86_9HYPH|nr:carbonic anhydrase [Sinorhizobium medicae]PND18022.1 carbonate dehydratase [Ensifer sp. MMN_5]ABR64770.1 Carbonate dehydratase [Sinorhizobium medicae WSM419]MBO1945062.1 carbonic anhydrase [Sinorhizobium medicae]MBO1960402.1 carbonic anhydrase [Sinorhizobium medicae]MDX0408898.1 carbonate dehydratase [Sinorhizobium medicae]